MILLREITGYPHSLNPKLLYGFWTLLRVRNTELQYIHVKCFDLKNLRESLLPYFCEKAWSLWIMVHVQIFFWELQKYRNRADKSNFICLYCRAVICWYVWFIYTDSGISSGQMTSPTFLSRCICVNLISHLVLLHSYVLLGLCIRLWRGDFGE